MKAQMPRNIVFIFSDQHNPKWTGYEGHPFVRTPNLDRLALSGVRFNSAYTPNPICVPARHCLLSGTYSCNNNVYVNSAVPPLDLPSFARYFTENGWRTCLIGKGHFQPPDRCDQPREYVHRGYTERPFGDLIGNGHQSYPHRLSNPELEGRGSGHGNHVIGGTFHLAGPSGIPEFQESEHQVTAEAVRWLQIHRATERERPFLLSLHYAKPHFPWQCPRRWFETYRSMAKGWVRPPFHEETTDWLPVYRAAWRRYLGYGATQADLDRGLAGYAGNVSYLDEMVGHVLDSLAHLGYLEDTLIVYASDHGEMAGAHGLWHKQLFYEESSRVPLIFSGPGVGAGEQRQNVVSLVDLFPTLCQTVGLAIPEHCDGVSLAPLFARAGELPDRTVYSEIACWPKAEPDWIGCMARRERWKYCWYTNGAEELYDLESDPTERVNLATDPEFRTVRDRFYADVQSWWQPERLGQRLSSLPNSAKSSSAIPPYQFALPTGEWVDAWP